MKTQNFEVASYVGSFLEFDKIPTFKDEFGKVLEEIALIGRSNVGKSSLINALTKKRNLAKTSATPGKTKTINYFNIDDSFLLVDLPGYGYAKSDKSQKEIWANHLDTFLKNRKTLKSLLLLIDIRRELSEEDLQMIEFCKYKKIKILIVFTKVDKLNRQECNQQILKNLESAQTTYGSSLEYVLFSTQDQKYRLDLIKKILLF